MTIVSIELSEKISRSCMKITTEDNSVFFIREDYLQVLDIYEVMSALAEEASVEISVAEESDLLDAGLAFAAEKKACDYLARAEQCRAGLARKLRKKNYDEASIWRALDFLESIGFLSDSRFARAWLANRNVAHAEGRAKLLAGLLRRGVERGVANMALDEFCGERSESERLSRAVQKIMRLQKNKTLAKEKIIEKLIRQGFAYKDAKQATNQFPK